MSSLPPEQLEVLAARADVLVEALPYIRRFRNEMFVVKLGGSLLDEPGALEQAALDVSFLAAVGVAVTLAHGGGKAITRGMEAAGIEPVFQNGLRVTDEATLDIMQRLVDGEVSRAICEALGQHGAVAEGIPGRTVFRCRRVAETGQPGDLGFVGRTEFVDTETVLQSIEQGRIPVVSPTASDESGQVYNTNADTAAAHLAVALKARRLIYLSDVPGLLRDPADPRSLISSLDRAEGERLIGRGIISRGMIPKVLESFWAIEQGVRRVHFIDGRVRHSLLLEIFTHEGVGTEIVSNPNHKDT